MSWLLHFPIDLLLSFLSLSFTLTLNVTTLLALLAILGSFMFYIVRYYILARYSRLPQQDAINNGTQVGSVSPALHHHHHEPVNLSDTPAIHNFYLLPPPSNCFLSSSFSSSSSAATANRIQRLSTTVQSASGGDDGAQLPLPLLLQQQQQPQQPQQQQFVLMGDHVVVEGAREQEWKFLPEEIFAAFLASIKVFQFMDHSVLKEFARNSQQKQVYAGEVHLCYYRLYIT
jgi:hypothetical protein